MLIRHPRRDELETLAARIDGYFEAGDVAMLRKIGLDGAGLDDDGDPTVSLSQTIHAIFDQTTATRSQKAMVVALVAHFSMQMRRMTRERAIKSAALLIDERNRERDASRPTKPVSCKRGCNACCHVEVRITAAEASVLVEEVRRGRATVDWDQALAMARIPRGDFHRRPKAERRCPFLEPSGECGAYAARPLACRAHRATTPAAYCDRDSGGGEPVESPVDTHVAALINAIGYWGTELLPAAIIAKARERGIPIEAARGVDVGDG